MNLGYPVNLPSWRIFKNSLVLRIGSAMAAIALLAMVGMAVSGGIAQSIQGNGAAINLAGSLRMQSWRMTSVVLRIPPGGDPALGRELQSLVGQFDRTLAAKPVRAMLPALQVPPGGTTYAQVVAQWRNDMRPHLLAVAAHGLDAAGRAQLLQATGSFVPRIDQLVKEMEQAAEEKISVMRLVLAATLIGTALVMLMTVYLIHITLARPLQDLLLQAGRVGRGDLAARVEHTGADELGRLGVAFNRMTEDLSRLYQDLEARVEEKTAALTTANSSLALLYRSIARLYNGPVAPETYSILLRDLEDLLGLEHGVACLTEEGETRAHVLTSTFGAVGQAALCRENDCATCLGSVSVSLRTSASGRHLVMLPLRDAEHNYGVMQLELARERQLEPWQWQLLEALSRHIGIAIGTARRSEQRRRISLLEERAAIARELHDSLAQSLAYMKIQVSRLEALLSATEAARPVLAELREGLNSSYRQLRELLTTFRLKMEDVGFHAALEKTVTEFSERGDISIALDIDLRDRKLTPNEEIHLLQIVREALSNVLHHSGASRAEVSLHPGPQGQMSLSISDNGIGIRKGAEVHHYGLAIMKERARSLGAIFMIEPREGGGTRVSLNFVPAGLRAPEEPRAVAL